MGFSRPLSHFPPKELPVWGCVLFDYVMIELVQVSLYTHSIFSHLPSLVCMTYFNKELKPFVGPALQVGFLASAIIMVNKLREIDISMSTPTNGCSRFGSWNLLSLEAVNAQI